MADNGGNPPFFFFGGGVREGHKSIGLLAHSIADTIEVPLF